MTRDRLDGRIVLDGAGRRMRDERISDGRPLAKIIEEALAKKRAEQTYECEPYS